MYYQLKCTSVIIPLILMLSCNSSVSRHGASEDLQRLAAQKSYGYRVLKELEHADTIELFKFDYFMPRADIGAEGTFRGWKVLTRAYVTGEEKRQLIDALRNAIESHDGSVAAAYDKERGIRAITIDGHVIEIELSFFSYQVLVTRDGELDGSFTIAESARNDFERVLRHSGERVADPTPIPSWVKEVETSN
jgi:hypothetical protein